MTDLHYGVLDLTIRDDKKTEGTFQVLHHIRPDWQEDDVTIQPLHGGIMTKDACHEKTDLKVFVVVIPKEGWARVAAPILLLV